MKAAPAGSALTFDWPGRERFPFILFGCVFLSLVIHAGTFFVFQVVYPQRVTIPPPPPQVALLTASSPENEALLRWIAAEDPALVATARSVVPASLLEVPYRPSYNLHRAAPLGSVETPAPLQFPPAHPPLTIIASAAPQPVPEAPAPLPMRTTLDVSTTLADRALKPPAFHWKQRSAQPLQALRALIGVTAQGEVRFTFLQHSSGDETLDAEALAQLSQLSFAPGDAAITWATATVEFGAEAYADVPAEIRQRAAP
jgi:hypothetical protein